MNVDVVIIILIVALICQALLSLVAFSISNIYTDRFGSYYKLKQTTTKGWSLWRPVKKIWFFYLPIKNLENFWLDDYDFVYVEYWKALYGDNDFNYIKEKLKEYNESNPRMDETTFIRGICRKLNVSRDRAHMLIQEVRKNG